MLIALKEQIDTIFRKDPAARSVIEVLLCYPGFHAILLHRLAHKLHRAGIPLFPRLLSQISRSLQVLKSIQGRPSAVGSLSIMGWAS